MNGGTAMRSRRLARAFAVSALIAGSLAAWLVNSYTGQVERRAGRPVPVLVAAQPIAHGELINPEMIGTAIVERRVPLAFAPADAIGGADRLDGARAIADIAAGAYLTEPLFTSGADTAGNGYRLRRSERALSIDTLVAPDGATVRPGAIVDLFASGFSGGSDTSLLLAGAEVLVANESPTDSNGESSVAARWRLTVRVGATQAAALIRGDVFAKELRAVTHR